LEQLKKMKIDEIGLPNLHEYYGTLNFSERSIFFESIRDNFLGKGYLFDRKNYYDFFYLYVNWCWLNLNDQDRETIDSEVFLRQVPVAAMNGYDLIDKTLSFLWFKSYSKKDLEGVFVRIKQAVINSEALVGKDSDQDYLLKDLVLDVQRNNSNNDSMEIASFQVKLEKILTKSLPISADQLFLDSVENVAKMLIGFANFLLGVENDKIWYVCDLWAHPEKYDNVNGVVKKGDNASSGISSDIQNRPEGEELHRFIISSLKNEFQADSDGQLLEIDQVLGRLEDLSSKYDDDSIRDLYYFNEATGKFEWKE